MDGRNPREHKHHDCTIRRQVSHVNAMTRVASGSSQLTSSRSLWFLGVGRDKAAQPIIKADSKEPRSSSPAGIPPAWYHIFGKIEPVSLHTISDDTS